jgi:uncharacterized protein with von Willebrand factor type A (vWA) domain
MAVVDAAAVRTQQPTATIARRAAQTDTLDVDLVTMATAFCQRLHAADMIVTPAQTQQYAISLSLTQPRSLRQLYFTTRAIFVTDMDQETTFDGVFAEIFGTYARTDGDDLVRFDEV